MSYGIYLFLNFFIYYLHYLIYLFSSFSFSNWCFFFYHKFSEFLSVLANLHLSPFPLDTSFLLHSRLLFLLRVDFSTLSLLNYTFSRLRTNWAHPQEQFPKEPWRVHPTFDPEMIEKPTTAQLLFLLLLNLFPVSIRKHTKQNLSILSN